MFFNLLDSVKNKIKFGFNFVSATSHMISTSTKAASWLAILFSVFVTGKLFIVSNSIIKQNNLVLYFPVLVVSF